MKKEAKIKSLEKIEINHDDWCVILQGLKLEEQRLREYAFYSGVKNDYNQYHDKLIGLLMKVERIVNITEPPSIKKARRSVRFK